MSNVSSLEAEYELEADDDEELEGDPGEDFENDEELDDEPADELSGPQTYAERFQELASREFESDEEVEAGLRDILGEMEQQYFFKSLLKRGSGLLKKVAQKGISAAAGQLRNLPIAGALKGITGLLGKNLTDQLLRLASSAIPGGAVAFPALKALGLVPGQTDSEAWQRFADVAQEVYETAADKVTEEIIDPIAAAQTANQVMTSVLRKHMRGGERGARVHVGGRRVVHLRSGESLTIVCK